MKINRLKESRIEDELYFNGCFWIIADSYRNILLGDFLVDGLRYLVDINGVEKEKTSKSSKVHEKVWNTIAANYNNVSWRYYPRGRVSIYNGEVFINLNSKINLPQVIDKVIEYYGLEKFSQDKIHIFDIDNIQSGNHYDFELI